MYDFYTLISLNDSIYHEGNILRSPKFDVCSLLNSYKYVVKQIYGIHVRDISFLNHKTRHVLSLSYLIITFEQSECHISLSRLVTLFLSTLRDLINSAIKLTDLMWQHFLLGVIPNVSFILILIQNSIILSSLSKSICQQNE